MNLPIKKKRALAAAETRKIILQAASDLFIKNGFEGVSISQIAKKAEINQSLIYHYFESKEELWKSVKNTFVDTYVNKENVKFDIKNGLEYTLRQIVYSRFEFYEQSPDIVRMMTWQRLEATKNNLAGGTLFSPENWKEVFLQFQKKGKIRKGIDLDMMILFIMSLIAGALTEDYKVILKDPKNKVCYLDLIVSSCMQSFSDS
jgi:AcrR family transcriptional regulator